MKWPLALTLAGVLALLAGLLVWLRAPAPPVTAHARATELLLRFEGADRPVVSIDLAERYGGRLELLDPRRALPTWHLHPTSDALALRAATRRCPTGSPPRALDAELAKALAWEAALCAGGDAAARELAGAPPFLHPSGHSYASLAVAATKPGAEWIAAHKRSFHVLELAELDGAILDDAERALGSLPPAAWRAVLEGDTAVLTERFLVLVERSAFGPTRLSLHRRAAWDAFAEQASVSLLPLGSPGCAEPATSALCWHVEPLSRGARATARALLGLGAALVAGGLGALLFALVQARRDADRERIWILRTLTHELRTPATSLRLDVEPLRAAFDELPEDCQEPVLRLLDGVERLSRVLDVTGRALSLLEAPRGAKVAAMAVREVPFLRGYFDGLREQWPEDVAFAFEGADAPFRTDPDWLAVAVRNLVENAVRHGAPPVRVEVSARPSELTVRVSDGGRTEGLSLKLATAPFRRGPESGGLGLGLAIADRVATRLGGRLRHEPDPTTFELRIPSREEPS